ncbi:MAG TPA: nucleoside hydrolase [Thermoanaerobaculia bacterium]|jgi:inosine-uridine nucleoside N-ribohydrolase|nr:nucleoside hydrolase [Thermoanaerobaculia bacterium]
MLFVDSDNALGSPSGDVDDAFALAALIGSGAEIIGISSVAGNTSEERAFANNQHLCKLLGWSGPLMRGNDAHAVLRTFPGRIVALGPLTNVAHARGASEVIVVGGRLHTIGRWPPVFPHEFNLTKDARAAQAVFATHLPLTIFPLDVARNLWVLERDLLAISGELGEVLRDGARRWFRRLMFLRATRKFAIYDLPAALYALGDDGFTMERTTAVMRQNTFLEFGRGTREVTVCTKLDRARLWERFLTLGRTSPAPHQR